MTKVSLNQVSNSRKHKKGPNCAPVLLLWGMDMSTVCQIKPVDFPSREHKCSFMKNDKLHKFAICTQKVIRKCSFLTRITYLLADFRLNVMVIGSLRF